MNSPLKHNRIVYKWKFGDNMKYESDVGSAALFENKNSALCM